MAAKQLKRYSNIWSLMCRGHFRYKGKKMVFSGSAIIEKFRTVINRYPVSVCNMQIWVYPMGSYWTESIVM